MLGGVKISRLKTRTWHKLENAVKRDKRALNTLNNHQAKMLQEEINNRNTISSSKQSIGYINKDLSYFWQKEKYKVKKGKRTVTKTKKVWIHRKIPARPTKDQAEQLARFNRDLNNAQVRQNKLKNSKHFKQTKRHRRKLEARLKKDNRNLNKFRKRRHKNATKTIKKAVKKQYSDFLAPKASLYETNGSNGKVVFIFATSETEDNQNTITSYPSDHGESNADDSINGDKTISIEGRLQGHTRGNKMSATQQYNQILDWRYHGVELTYRSNGAKGTHNMVKIYNKHFRIQSLTKTQSQPLKDEIVFTLSLKFVYAAEVTSTKQKVKNKGQKVPAGMCVAPKTVTGKKGMTMYDYSKKYHTTVKNLVKMNANKHYTAHTNLAGKKLQVTKGKFKSNQKTRNYARPHHAKVNIRKVGK
ncbi:phage baseplate protein [Apilactobacillus micheneri]|uniref:phage baseplate protein n=1 Tax=Apilactobacillus micheneri TaxID=1899430 RepID=UPI001128EB93|nr:hypothetical protein [Apilactobacillus micheneri]